MRRATPGEVWTVDHLESHVVAAKARDEIAKGNTYAGFELIKYITFAEGLGALGDFRKVVSNDLLGLEKEDLEANVKQIVDGIKRSK